MTLRLPSRLATVQALLLVLAALLAAVVLPRLGPVQPDLLVPFVVAGGLRGGRTTGLLLGLAAGWLVDLVPPGTGALGLSPLTYAGAGLVAGAAHRSSRHSAALPAVTVLAAAAVVLGVRLVVTLLDGRPLDLVGAGLSLLATTVIGAALVPPLVHHQRRLVHRGRA